MNEKEMQKVLDELKDVRPEMLNEEGKRLFDAIMKIADQRDEFKEMYESVEKEYEELYKRYSDFNTYWVHIDDYKKLQKEVTDFQSNWVHIDKYLKLKRQTEMSAKEFGKTLDKLNKMIELLIEDLHSEGALLNMTSEEIYRYYEKRTEIEEREKE